MRTGSSAERRTGNFVWLAFGGLWMAAAYAVAGVIGYALVLTAPYGRAAFYLAAWHLAPFSRAAPPVVVVDSWFRARRVIWFVVAAWWLAVAHLLAAGLLTLTGDAAVDYAGVHARTALYLLGLRRTGRFHRLVIDGNVGAAAEN